MKSFVFLYARYWCNNGNYYSYSTPDVGQYVNQYSHQIISRDNPELWILTFVQFHYNHYKYSAYWSKVYIYLYSYKLSLSELIKIMQASNRASINAKQTFFWSEINV